MMLCRSGDVMCGRIYDRAMGESAQRWKLEEKEEMCKGDGTVLYRRVGWFRKDGALQAEVEGGRENRKKGRRT